MTLRGGREALDERTVQEARDGGREEQKQPRRPPPQPMRVPDVRRVLLEARRHPRPPADSQVKEHGGSADDSANECGGDAEQGTMGGDRVADANARPRSRALGPRGLIGGAHRFAIST